MQTVGQLLKKTREEKGLTLESVEESTKIRLRYLEALEKDDYRALPSAIAARGFIRNYGKLLSLPNETLQALFRRDFLETDSGQVVPRGMVKPLNEPEVFSWNPKRTAFLLTGIVVLALGFYFIRQLIFLGSSPSLRFIQPQEGQNIDAHELVVVGQTDPEAAVQINGQLAQVEKDGSFRFSLDLPSGKNVITITSTSKSNKVTKLTRTVYIK